MQQAPTVHVCRQVLSTYILGDNSFGETHAALIETDVLQGFQFSLDLVGDKAVRAARVLVKSATERWQVSPQNLPTLLQEETSMANESEDQPVLGHIDRLVKEEERLYAQSELKDGDRDRLAKIKVELDQCWDLLRQRRALREFGRDPDQAKVRPPKVVENYEQ
jgi:Protein of unknown function (DUF2630)